MLCPRARYFILRIVVVKPRKTGKCPDMTEELLTGRYMLSINTNKQATSTCIMF